LAAVGPWHLLVGCLMLNRTTRAQAKKVLLDFFSLVGRPEDLTAVSDGALLAVLRPCGLGRRRLAGLRLLTEDYLAGKPVSGIRFCGPYARASHEIFVEGLVPPPTEVTDAELVAYLEGCASPGNNSLAVHRSTPSSGE
jgi:methyl-CpG-binding domain protein 4